MNAIDVMYQTSLAQFIEVFKLSMHHSERANIPAKRIHNIIEELTWSTFLYIGRGLFEKHKVCVCVCVCKYVYMYVYACM